MVTLKENNITAFDCDGTLVIWSKDPTLKAKGTIPFQYGDELIYLYPHKAHIRFLKHCSDRGDYIEVWSQNGYNWAEQVIQKLDLVKYVNVCRSKPVRHVDDKTTLEDIVGNRIFMKQEIE